MPLLGSGWTSRKILIERVVVELYAKREYGPYPCLKQAARQDKA